MKYIILSEEVTKIQIYVKPFLKFFVNNAQSSFVNEWDMAYKRNIFGSEITSKSAKLLVTIVLKCSIDDLFYVIGVSSINMYIVQYSL